MNNKPKNETTGATGTTGSTGTIGITGTTGIIGTAGTTGTGLIGRSRGGLRRRIRPIPLLRALLSPLALAPALVAGRAAADLVFECHPSEYDFPVAFTESVEGKFSNNKTYLLGAYDTDYQKPLGLTLECNMTYTVTGSVDNCIYRIDTYNDPGTASFSPKLHFKGVSYSGSADTSSEKYPFCEKLLGAIYIGTWSAANPSGMTFTGEGVNTITGPLNTPAVRTEAKSSGDYANAYLYIKSGTFVFAHGEADADSSYWTGRGQELTDVHAVRFYIEGGSVILKHRTSAYLPTLFKSATRVYGVERTGFTPGAPVAISCEQLPNYNFSNIYADTEGKICLWIPAGTYDMAIDGADEQWAVSAGADDLYATVAVQGGAITSTGVLIDNLGDVIAGTNKDVNADWWFRAEGGNKYELHLVRGNHTLSGENYDGQVRVIVAPGVESLTIENLKLDIGSSSAAAIALEDEAAVPIIVKGYCQLTGGLNRPAIRVPSTATLTIDAADTNQVLIAQGGGNAAGIGGAFHDSQDSHAPFGWDGTSDNRYNARCEVGTIIINGGRIEATGGEGTLVAGESGYHNGSSSTTGGGAGIGAAIYGLATHPIVINGGHVIARGGSAGAGSWGGAGIGGGLVWSSSSSHVPGKADVERVEIHGGVVDAQGGRSLTGATGQAAAIGTGDFGYVKDILIDGGTITASADGGAAAIGAGYSGKAGTITIGGGTVTASAQSGAAIGGAQNYAPASACYVEHILISNGVVNASVSGSTAGAAIGGGYLQAGGLIEITGGQITAQGSGGSAGIGTGYNTAAADRDQTVIRVTGGTVVARGSRAWNGQSSAGLGSGAYTSSKGTQHVTDLAITGGSVRSLDGAGNANPSELGSDDAKRVCRTITLDGYANTRVTALQLESGAAAIDYGFNGVWTDDAGKLYLWFPESIDVSDTSDWTFQYEENGQTLSLHGGEVALFSSGVFLDGEELTAFTFDGDGWSWAHDTGTLTLRDGADVTLSGRNEAGVDFKVVVAGDSALTLSNLTLTGSAPVAVASNATATVLLAEANTLLATSTAPALAVPETASLVLDEAENASGSLLRVTADSAGNAAAIGGLANAGCGTIRIHGGWIIAKAGEDVSGIGGGKNATGAGAVLIDGGTVIAECLCDCDTFGVTGGSVVVDTVSKFPTNGVEEVYGFEATGFEPGQTVRVEDPVWLTGDRSVAIDNYRFEGIVADDSGTIKLWFPGAYDGKFRIGEDWYSVDSHNWEISRMQPIFVNGVNVLSGTGDDWSFAGKVLTLNGAGPYVLSGESVNSDVHVVVVADATVVVSNLVIETSDDTSPFALGAGVHVDLLLAGQNSLTASGSAAGLRVASEMEYVTDDETYSSSYEVTSSSTLVIANAPGEEGSLTAWAKNRGAGIGGSEGEACGVIIINSGSVSASAVGAYTGLGAGIGSGSYGKWGGRIQINGGVVVASAWSGAGIGLGYEDYYTSGGVVEITGGTVIATSNNGAGIGGGVPSQSASDSGEVAISGGHVTAQSNHGAGIGGAKAYGSLAYAAAVTISGGIVIAEGGLEEADGGNTIDIGGEEYTGMSSDKKAGSPSKTVLLGGSVFTKHKNISPAPTDGVNELVPTSLVGAPIKAELVLDNGATTNLVDNSGKVELWRTKDAPLLVGDLLTVDGEPYTVTAANNVVDWPELSAAQLGWVESFTVETNVATFVVTNLYSTVYVWSAPELGDDWRDPIWTYLNNNVDENCHWESDDGTVTTDFERDGNVHYGYPTGALTIRVSLDPKQEKRFYRILTDGQANPNPDRYSEITVAPKE